MGGVCCWGGMDGCWHQAREPGAASRWPAGSQGQAAGTCSRMRSWRPCCPAARSERSWSASRRRRRRPVEGRQPGQAVGRAGRRSDGRGGGRGWPHCRTAACAARHHPAALCARVHLTRMVTRTASFCSSTIWPVLSVSSLRSLRISVICRGGGPAVGAGSCLGSGVSAGAGRGCARPTPAGPVPWPCLHARHLEHLALVCLLVWQRQARAGQERQAVKGLRLTGHVGARPARLAGSPSPESYSGTASSTWPS